MFEWSYQAKDSKVLLVAVPAHIDEKGIVYGWSGTQFKDVSSAGAPNRSYPSCARLRGYTALRI
jgi:hypothetical protein